MSKQNNIFKKDTVVKKSRHWGHNKKSLSPAMKYLISALQRTHSTYIFILVNFKSESRVYPITMKRSRVYPITVKRASVM